jgi:TP901 family phage tail tape measure protein
MAEVEELRLVLRTISDLAGATQTRDALRQTRQAADQYGNAATTAARSQAALGSSFNGSAGQALRFGATLVGLTSAAALVHAAISEVLTTSIEFGGQMAGVAAVSGATAGQLERLSEAARTGGIGIGIGAREGARGLQELIKSGVGVEAALGGGLRSTQLLAKAGGVDLAQAAEISATAMNSFGLSAADLARVADRVAGAANASAIGVDDFRLSLAQAGAVARTAGVSFDDTAVAIAVLGQAGIKGSDAGTSLRTFLLSLGGTSREASDELRRLGIITADGANRFFDATGKARGLAEVSQILKTSLVGYTDQQRLATLQIIFGTDALRAAAIFAREGATGFDALSASMSKVSASDVANKRLNSLQGDLQKLEAQAEATAIAVEKALDPSLRGGAQATTGLLKGLEGALDTGFIAAVFAGDANAAAVALARGRLLKRAESFTPSAALNAESDLRVVVNQQLVKEAQEAANPPAQKFLETWRTIDATLINSRDSFAQITRDIAEIQAVSATLGTLVDALGTSNPGLTAELTTLQSIEKIRIGIRAQDAAAVAERNRALDKEASKITDPRDAAGALAARERVRLTEQLVPLELAVAEANRQQKEITDTVAAAKNAEARAVLQILPQRQEIARVEREIAQAIDRGLQLRQEEARLLAQQRAGPATNALEDTQATIQRNELLLGVRGQDPDVRRAARAENRNLTRNVLPGQQLEAFNANEQVRQAERTERTQSIQDRLRANRGEQRLEGLRGAAQPGENLVFALAQNGERMDLLGRSLSEHKDVAQQALDAFIKKAAEPVKLEVKVDVTGPDGNTVSYAELIEAESRAQTPPVIQVSAVRR